MAAITQWWDSMREKAGVDARRREDLLYHFQAATFKKAWNKREYRPSNVGYFGLRNYPSATLDNWSAAWKVRRHWEDQTELRKAAGKTIY